MDKRHSVESMQADVLPESIDEMVIPSPLLVGPIILQAKKVKVLRYGPYMHH